MKKDESRWHDQIKVYDSAIGGVDLLDSAVGTYCTNIKGKSGGGSILQIHLAF